MLAALDRAVTLNYGFCVDIEPQLLETPLGNSTELDHDAAQIICDFASVSMSTWVLVRSRVDTGTT